jgi:hypothetical protein
LEQRRVCARQKCMRGLEVRQCPLNLILGERRAPLKARSTN